MTSIIRNSATPICRLCKHIIIDTKYPQEYTMARCLKSGVQCMVTGEINYDFAYYSRRNDTLCGKEGKFFDKS